MFIEVKTSNTKTMVSVSKIIQILHQSNGDTSIGLVSGDYIRSQESYEEIKAKIAAAQREQLRNQFAMAAISGICREYGNYLTRAKDAYLWAERMLEES